MLFLAVFCGFLAEYQLEHKIEKDREKVFVRNMYEDLITDTSIYQNYSRSCDVFAREIDSLLILMRSPDRDDHLDKIYFYARNVTITTSNIVFPNQRTYTQLKHSGQLRLIHKQDVANSISFYYQKIDQVFSKNNLIFNQVAHYWEEAGNLFDAGVFYKIRQEKKPPAPQNLKLLSNDPAAINRFLSSAQYYYGSRMNQKEKADKMVQLAKALMNLIKSRYNLN